jgi:hypothetical protein
MNTDKKSRSAGRPPKFREARRPVTITLPVRILELLSRIDPDRARAIVKLAEAVHGAPLETKPVEIVEMAPHRGLIVVGDSALIRSLEGVRLIEIAPGRHLITVKANLSVESIEVQIHDMIEEGRGEPGDIARLKDLLQHIRHQRRRKAVSKEELLVISM